MPHHAHPYPTYPSKLLPSYQHPFFAFPASVLSKPILSLTNGTLPSPSSCSLWRNSHLSFVMKYLRVHSTLSYLSYGFLPRTSSSNYTHVLTWTTFAANGSEFLFWMRILLQHCALRTNVFIRIIIKLPSWLIVFIHLHCEYFLIPTKRYIFCYVSVYQ